jgi:hypothetical protein
VATAPIAIERLVDSWPSMVPRDLRSHLLLIALAAGRDQASVSAQSAAGVV